MPDYLPHDPTAPRERVEPQKRKPLTRVEFAEWKACANCGAKFYRNKNHNDYRWSRSRCCSASCHTQIQLREQRGSPHEYLRARYQVADSGCWEWTGGLNDGGYGRAYYDGRKMAAHRLAFEVHSGQPVGNKFVCHRCDNRKCVNPDHLFIGTAQDNIADMVAKRRNNFGSKNGMARLTDGQVEAIREVDLPVSTIARLCGVSDAAVYAVLAGRSWTKVR